VIHKHKTSRLFDISDGIYSITQFKRQTAKCIAQLTKSRRPSVLTVHGKARVVIQDVISYQQLLDRLARAEEDAARNSA
jgi:PHD/YefM family antitoxin component YafN of YafNO toxin-antitoxin module